jgi:hypothetical protein
VSLPHGTERIFVFFLKHAFFTRYIFAALSKIKEARPFSLIFKATLPLISINQSINHQHISSFKKFLAL